MKERDKLSRRKFLGVAGASTLAAGTKIACSGQISESSKSIPIAGEYDVIAGGGGTIGNVHKLASLTAYKLQESSPLIDEGLDLHAQFGIDPGKHDFYRNALPQGGKLNVGAAE